MAGLVGQYNQVPRLFNQVAINKILPTTIHPVIMKNVRGQVLISIFQSDGPPGVFSSFGVTGGFGEWPDDYTRNWYFSAASTYNCSITSPAINIMDVTTMAPNFPSRTYRFIFSFNQSVPPTVQLIGGAPIGVETITVNQTKQSLIEGF